MNSNDLRVKKTRQRIADAFLQLLAQKPYREISITEIVSRAMVNRTTFYAHYLDKDDLLQKLLEQVEGAFEAQINPSFIELNASNIQSYHSEFQRTMQFCIQNRETYLILWQHLHERNVFEEMTAIIVRKIRVQIEADANLSLTRPGYAELYARLFAANMMTMVRWKLESGDGVGVDELSLTMTNHMMYGIFASLRCER